MTRYVFLLTVAACLAACLGGCTSQESPTVRPACVMIIRHGEKTGGDETSLSHLGKKRADELIDLFKPDRPFPRPDFLFAARDSKNSDRPVETLDPLSRSLGLAVDHKFTDKDSLLLADKIFKDRKYQSKNILICWHHAEIPALARAFLATSAPDHWDGKVFDRVWKITYDGGVKFADLPQDLPVDRHEDKERDKERDKTREKDRRKDRD